MKKLLLLFLTFCLMLTVLSGCSQRLPTLTVTFFDVGKGDCILLECDGHAAMIDAGFDNTANDILSALADKGIDTLDFLLLTHMDKDHVGGADKFLENLTIGCGVCAGIIEGRQAVSAICRCAGRQRQDGDSPRRAVDAVLCASSNHTAPAAAGSL